MRQCTKCDTKNYSADTKTEIWICIKCGEKLYKELEKSVRSE